MIIETKIIAETAEETVSKLTIDAEDYGVILEDQFRAEKVMSDTRIPRKSYKLGLRKVGGHHARYSARYPSFHIGMIEILDVPNFQFILFHIGNTDKDTAGCLLNGTNFNEKDGRLFVTGSEAAYIKFYKKVAPAIEAGELVELLHGI